MAVPHDFAQRPGAREPTDGCRAFDDGDSVAVLSEAQRKSQAEDADAEESDLFMIGSIDEALRRVQERKEANA